MTQIKSIKPHKPTLPPIQQLTVARVTILQPEAQLERQSLHEVTAFGAQADNMHIDECAFDKVSLNEAHLQKLSTIDSTLVNCDLSSAQCSEASLLRTAISRNRLTGTDFSSSVLTDVSFTGCKLDMANFRFSRLTRVVFIDCTLLETDFMGTTITDVRFEDCVLEKVSFSQAGLKRVDARGSRLVALQGWQALKGLTIDSVQLTTVAPQLAAELGLTVVDL